MFESSLLSPLACHPSYGLWLPLLLPPRRAPGIPQDNLLLLLSPPPPPPPPRPPPPSAREANDPEAAIGARADHDLERMHNYVFIDMSWGREITRARRNTRCISIIYLSNLASRTTHDSYNEKYLLSTILNIVRNHFNSSPLPVLDIAAPPPPGLRTEEAPGGRGSRIAAPPPPPKLPPT